MTKQNPTFFIGLGGHGSGIVDKLAKQVKNRPDWKNIANLNHFIAIDTDKGDLEKKTFIPESNRVCISNFDKFSYQQSGFGRSYSDADPKLTSWLPNPEEYPFRKTAGKGAGQVRLESRLGVYYNVAVERDLVATIERCINQSLDAGDAYRRDDMNMRFFIFGSVAGGTGSGAFLAISYLVQSLVNSPWTPHVTMFLSLPTLFKDKVGSLYKNVCVNGYAALKELEFMLSKMAYDQDPKYPYRFSGEEADGIVDTPPAGLICIMDRPTKVVTSDVSQSIADAAYLLVFTNMLSSVEGELDNFEAEAKTKLVGFSSRYGTIGSHLLLFPRHDIIEYATRRRMVDILQESLSFSGKEKNTDGTTTDFSVNYDDPKFKRKSDKEQNKEIDEKFIQYIDYKYQEENRDDAKGMFTDIVGPDRESALEKEDEDISVLPNNVNGPVLGDGKTLWDKFFTETTNWMNEVEDKINAFMEVPSRISPENPSVTKIIDTMTQQNAAMARELRQDAESKAQDIVSGKFFSRLFRENKVGPIAQRYFLIHLAGITLNNDGTETVFVPPYQYNGEASVYLSHELKFPPQSIQTTKQDLNKQLQAASDQSIWEKMTDRDNKKFKLLASRVLDQLGSGGLLGDSNSTLRANYWQIIQTALSDTVHKMLDTFRQVGRTAFERLKEEKDQCDRFLQNPASVNPNAQISQFETMMEALRDDSRAKRLWDCFYVDKFTNVDIDTKLINNIIVGGFAPVEDMGQTRSPGANEVVHKIKTELSKFLKDRFTSELNEMGMNVEEAIKTEARYLVAQEEVYQPGEPDSAQINIFAPEYDRTKRDRLLHRVKTEPALVNRVREKIAEKVQTIARDVCVLANIPPSSFAGERPAMDSIYYSLESSPNGGDGTAINLREIIENNFGNQLRQSRTTNKVDDARREDDSQSGEKDRVIFLYSQFNLPLFAFENVIREMEPHYKRARKEQNRKRIDGDWAGYRPSHTEWDWETDKVKLIDLNPMEMKEALKKKARLKEVILFFKTFFFDTFSDGEDGSMMYNSVTGLEKFATNRQEGFEHFLSPPEFDQVFSQDDKKDLIKEVSQKWSNAIVEFRFYQGVIQRLQTHLKNSKIQDKLARKAMLVSLSSYYQDEAEVIEALINDLEVKLKTKGY